MEREIRDFDDIARIVASPETSYWLKGAWEALMHRDIVDAMNDVTLLNRMLTVSLEIHLGKGGNK